MPENVYKISRIYLEGSAYLHHQNPEQYSNLVNILRDTFSDDDGNTKARKNFVTHLVNITKPPSGNNQVLRLIHPDLMAGFLLVITIIMIIRAGHGQVDNLPALLVLGGLVLIGYLTFRKKGIQIYEERKLLEKAEIAKIEKGVTRWMRLYYCAADQIFFDPETSLQLEPDSVKNYLIKG